MADAGDQNIGKMQPTILELAELEKENSTAQKIEPKINEKNNVRRYEVRYRPDFQQNDSFQLLFRHIGEPAVLVDNKKRIMDVNPSFSRMTSYQREEIIGKKINSILRKNTILTKNNGTKEFEANEIKIGLSTLYLFIDKNEIDTKFKISNELEALKTHLDDFVIKVKKDGKIIYMNPNFKTVFSNASEGENLKNYLKINKFHSKLKIASETGQPELSEGTMEINDKGQIRNCPINVKIIPSKEELIIIVKNQIEKLDLNKQIEDAKQEYEAIVNNVTDIICIIDKKGKFQFVNKQFERQLGYKKENLPLLPQIIYHEDLPKFLQTLTEIERNNRGFQELEISLYTSKRKLLNFSASGISKISDGNDVRYSVTLRDITAKKKSENETAKEREKLKEEYKKMKEINEMKTNFVSMVSHDLKTPLTNIQGYASLMRNKILGPNNPKQQEATEIIDKESKRLAKLINDLLDLSKIDAGAMVIQKKPFKLKDLEDKCSLKHLAEKKGLILIWNTPESLGEVYGDPERIAQVLTNLVNNAIKFTDHGSVTVNAFEKGKDNIQIDVIDTGLGIPKKDQEMIFERFQRSSTSLKFKKEGSGLGLAIAREIMKLHDSDIMVKSEVGKGSTFSIILSKAPKQQNERDKVNDYLEKMTH